MTPFRVRVKMTHFIMSKRHIFLKFSPIHLQFDTKYGYIRRLTPSGTIIGWDWREYDPFKLYNFQDLFKTFDLIPDMAIFRGCPVLSPFGVKVSFKTTIKTYIPKVLSRPLIWYEIWLYKYIGWPFLTSFKGRVGAE